MKKFIFAFLGIFAPGLAFAAFANFNQLVNTIATYVSVLVPILIGLGVVVLLWGIVKFIMGAGDEDKRSEGRQLMIWGIIGIFVMVSIWGLVNFIAVSTIGQGANQASILPTLPVYQLPDH